MLCFVLSSFVFHGFFARFSSPFVDGISWVKYFKGVLVFNECISSSFVLSFTQQRMKYPEITDRKLVLKPFHSHAQNLNYLTWLSLRLVLNPDHCNHSHGQNFSIMLYST